MKEGKDDRKGREEDEEEDGECAEPVARCQSDTGGRVRQRHHPLAQVLHLGWLEHRRNDGWQGLPDDRVGGLGCRRVAHGAEGAQVLATLRTHFEEIEDGVDDAPGEVASQGGEEHGPHVVPASIGHPKGAGDGEGHDEAEQDLGDPLCGFQIGSTPAARRPVNPWYLPSEIAMGQEVRASKGAAEGPRPCLPGLVSRTTFLPSRALVSCPLV